jgi:hypothetical protein
MEEVVQPLNFSVHAIEDFTELAHNLQRESPRSATSLAKTAHLLQRAVKFLLPNCADLVDLKGLSENHLDMLRLPFPLVALEVPWKSESGRFIADGPMKEAPSSKRMVLAWDEKFVSDPAVLTAGRGEPGIYVVSLYVDDNIKRWICTPVGAFIPASNTITKFKDFPGNLADSPANQLMLAQGWARPGSPTHTVEYFVVQPEMFELLASRLGPDVAAARMQLDLLDELMSLWKFCLTINCSNVRAVDVPPAAALNKKRIKNGKLPFFTYKVLQLPEPVASGKGRSIQLEGQRNSPRMHLRRGHPRRLPTGAMTYVRAAIISAASDGMVDKSYVVR